MRLESPAQPKPQLPKDDKCLDGDFDIEGDGGTVDTAGQVQVPPPRPPENC